MSFFYFQSILGIFIFNLTLPKAEKQETYFCLSTSPGLVICFPHPHLLKSVRSMRAPPFCSICLCCPPTREEVKLNMICWLMGGNSLSMVMLWKTADIYWITDFVQDAYNIFRVFIETYNRWWILQLECFGDKLINISIILQVRKKSPIEIWIIRWMSMDLRINCQH